MIKQLAWMTPLRRSVRPDTHVAPVFNRCDLGVLGCTLSLALGLALSGAAREVSAQASAQTQPTSAPAVRNSPDAVLVRFENTEATITQREFDFYFLNGPPVDFKRRMSEMVTELVNRKLLALYTADHPDLVPESSVDARVEMLRKAQNLTTDDQLVEFLKEKGLTVSDYRQRMRLMLARDTLLDRGRERGKDDALVESMIKANPDHFDGTERTARHILVAVLPYDTPETKAAKRAKAERIRDDLVSGRKTWAEAVLESDHSDRVHGGNLGYFTRHRRLVEQLASVAFSLPVDQYSEVIESDRGFHVLVVTSRKPGTRNAEETKNEARRWLESELYTEALMSTRQKYPPVGVQPPTEPVRPPPPPPATRPVTTRPGIRRPPMTRPAVRPPASRPAAGQGFPNRSPGTRPAFNQPPLIRRPPSSRPAGPGVPANGPAGTDSGGTTPK